jgi:hypothetical protein
MLAADGSNPLGYMFQATAEQKADAGMYANYLPQTAAFYIKNGIRIPSAPEIAIATQRSNTIRDTAGALTKLAAVASGATALVGLSPTLLTWALSHPAEATTLGMITTETAAAIQSGAITPALVMEAGAVKTAANGSINITDKGLAHVVERHTFNDIAKFVGKSKFNEGENLSSLITQGLQHQAVIQVNGNFARTFDVGRNIGIDRISGQQTSIMTVITRSSGDLVTAFPGHP